MPRQMFLAGVLLFVAAIPACSGLSGEELPEDRAVIVDRNQREWDVTYARDIYGMEPRFYNYGLGVGAIPSVDNPEVLSEGDPGYPPADSPLRIFGFDHNGERRAYGISDLSGHEVFNDTYPGDADQYLAVTY